MTKDDVLALLSPEKFVSGAELARNLGISRTAVWKAVKGLQADGCKIESVTSKGYRLTGDVLSAAGILRYTNVPNLQLQVFKTLPSTNTFLKELASKGAPDGTVIFAESQTAGRGRMGRSFFSPSQTGLYFSLLLRPQMPATEAIHITACAAVAVAEAIEALSGKQTQIKWVNDILLDGKKVSGILTEAAIDCETGMFNYAVLGIGINITSPEQDFPTEIRHIAGSVFDGEAQSELRCRLAAEILNRFFAYYPNLEEKAYFSGYKNRSLVLGKPIFILAAGAEPIPAQVLDLNEDFSLQVQLEDGTKKAVHSGEVSVRLQKVSL